MNRNSKEISASKFIPYTVAMDPYTSATEDWDLVRTIQVQGVPFETLSNATLNSMAATLLTTLNTMGSRGNRVGLWTHLIRRKINYDFSTIEYDNHFSTLFNKQYGDRLAGQDFFTNEMYISPVYRSAGNDMERYAQRLSRNKSQKLSTHQNSLAEMDKITNQLLASLRRYHPTLLGSHETEDGNLLADYAQLYARILNGGDSPPIAINQYSLKHAIQRSEITFMGDVVVLDRPDSTRYAAVLSLKAPYSVEKVRWHLLHGLLNIPCEYILSQSLTFLSASKGERYLSIQKEQIEGTTNNPLQVKELENAIAALQNGNFSMGEHEWTLAIFADSIDELSNAVSEALAALEKKNIEVFRENRGTLISQYFGMLPANFKTGRLRAQPISTNNFVSFFPMHNYATGSAAGSQWGMPIAMLKGAGGSPWFFNYHVPRQAMKEQGMKLEYEDESDTDESKDLEEVALESEADTHSAVVESTDVPAPAPTRKRAQRKESGNFLLIGPNGSGKTAVQCALRALARKKSIRKATRMRRLYKSFVFDKDSGQEIFILAMGGRYFRFKKGEPTGINLFSLPNNEASHLFIVNTAKWCAEQDETYLPGAKDEQDLLDAAREVYALPPEMRRWSRLLDTLTVSSPLAVALSRYCGKGAYAWVLDSEEDRFDLAAANDFGFDMTEFLEDRLARTPILSYLKYKIDLHAPGSPHSIELDEASTALKDAYLRHQFIEVSARTIRKKEGIIGLSFQDGSDATTGELAGILTTQFPTLMLFPNAQAQRQHYVEGLHLTENEFNQVVHGMHDAPGKFLLKRGIESAVVQLDLSGMGDILSVLSGSADNLPLVRDLINSLGNDPAIWLPEFFKRRM